MIIFQIMEKTLRIFLLKIFIGTLPQYNVHFDFVQMTWLEFWGQGSKVRIKWAQVHSMLVKAGTEVMPWGTPTPPHMQNKGESYSPLSLCFHVNDIIFWKYECWIYSLGWYTTELHSTQTACTYAHLLSFSLCGQVWFNFCSPLCSQTWQPWDKLHSHLLNECLAKSQQLTAPELVEVTASKPFLLPNVHSRSATFAKCSLGQKRDKRNAACHHLWVMAVQQKV